MIVGKQSANILDKKLLRTYLITRIGIYLH